MRLRSDIFVSAYIRRCAVEGAPAVLRRRGAAEAGSVFVKIDRLDGTCALFGPAPQSSFGEGEGERRFARLHPEPFVEIPTAEARLAREIKFDSDLWIIEVEDRAGLPRLDLVEV
ncbi:hypothetical protein GCM10007036_12520 [Alsobacter metallidurans]|uniref:DUF1491 family protein n=1 Tax=Alsobacter metallidurans TaxID=340221 RepID=A0A917MIW8_9HYPH|nr:DUF1491 family protein [Alsobacter metallidurans]GGH13716.1 hypothetical protein GCM10007036_12520 [Alsobacter metallidurans]